MKHLFNWWGPVLLLCALFISFCFWAGWTKSGLEFVVKFSLRYEKSHIGSLASHKLMTIAASEPTSLRLAAEALTYSAKIDVDLAREALSRSLKLDPDPRTMVKIAQIHLANGEYGQAAECYMRAAEMREAGHLDIGLNPMTLRNLGQRANGLAKVQDMYDQSIER